MASSIALAHLAMPLFARLLSRQRGGGDGGGGHLPFELGRDRPLLRLRAVVQLVDREHQEAIATIAQATIAISRISVPIATYYRHAACASLTQNAGSSPHG